MTRVAIAQNDDIEQAIEQALRQLDLRDVVAGKSVAVKPNETAVPEGDLTGVTQADTLRGVLRHLKQYEPSALVVTGGSGAGETDDVMRATGMMDVLSEESVEFIDHNRPPFEEVDLSYGPDSEVEGPQTAVMVNRRVLEYDTLVSLAQLKLHATATVTLTMKNIAMSYPAADFYGHPRAQQKHQHEFFGDMHSFIVAMARRFPIDLGIIVGHPAMIATGPLGGKAVETGLVIASRDAVAADTVGAKLLGFSSQAVRYLWEAGKIGLGETDPERMEFPGMSVDDAVRAFTERAYGEALTF
jgi:uncharacterized protein (DUF362 family)